MSENNPPVEGRVVESAKPLPQTTEYQPMGKAEAGVLSVLIVGVLGGLGWVIKTDIKRQEEEARKSKLEAEERSRKAEATRKARTAWFDEQRKNGMRVLELRDGRYVAVPNDAYSKAEIKKQGEWL